MDRKRNQGRPNHYLLRVPEIATANECATNRQAPPSELPEVPPSEVQCQPPQLERRKGTPFKVPQGREREAPSLFDWPIEVPVDILKSLAATYQLPKEVLTEAYTSFRKTKLTFGDEVPKVAADIWVIFQGWLEKNKEGKKFLNSSKAASVRASSPPAVALEEPPEWRIRLPEDDEDRQRSGSTRWEVIHPYYQERIAKKMRKLDNG